MVREATTQVGSSNSFALVLLTTFDATSRIIAHQEALIDTIVKQAKHLNISLVGIPMHRGKSSEGYVQRVRRGLDLIENETGGKVSTLVFGDLHLEHVKKWRQEQLGPLGYEMIYPLFNVPYETLVEDLDASQVPCQVSGSTIDEDVVAVGEMYTAELRQKLLATYPDIDLFGENGEFHTVAQVWQVERSVALGLNAQQQQEL